MLGFLDILFPPREDERRLRGESADAFCARISPRLVEAGPVRAAALLPLSDPVVRAAIHEAKYRGAEKAFALLAAALADALPEYLAEAEYGRGRAVLMPVPLGHARRLERGYNQVEEVVRRALARLGHPAVPLSFDASFLARTRETPSQVSRTGSERRENMRGAFAAAHAADGSNLYVIIDDVVTTGATLGACAEALALAGAAQERILPIALAH